MPRFARIAYGLAGLLLIHLLNHTVAGFGVTGSYVHLEHAHLREMQERASSSTRRECPRDNRPEDARWTPGKAPM